MRFSWLATCLWPGLSRLWLAAQWPGLLSAFAFALGLNFLLAATFIWPEWLDQVMLGGCWIIVALFWGYSAYSSLIWLRSDAVCQFGPQADRLTELAVTEGGGENRGEENLSESHLSLALLSTAQTEYLKGHWFEAESTLKELLSRHPRDVEARLLWVGILRRTKRFEAARKQLKLLTRLEGARVWALEVRDERRRLTRLAEEQAAVQAAEQAREHSSQSSPAAPAASLEAPPAAGDDVSLSEAA